MPAEVVFVLGPGATNLIANLATSAGPEFNFVPFDVMPIKLTGELPVAVFLTQKELAADPLIQAIAVMEPVSRRPGIIAMGAADLTAHGTLPTAIEKSWIQHSLAQFHELGGASFATEMIELFQGQSEQYLTELDAALMAGDATTAQRIVHTLKSTLANYGGRRLRETAQMLENEAARGNLAIVQQHSSDFAVGVRRFRDLLLVTAAEFSLEPAVR